LAKWLNLTGTEKTVKGNSNLIKIKTGELSTDPNIEKPLATK